MTKFPNLHVVKRDGKREALNLNKITSRISQQTYDLNREWVEPFEIAKKVIDGIYDGVTTRELDKLAAETAANLTQIHSDYAKLAARITITSLHKETEKSFSNTITKLYNYVDKETGQKAPLISQELYELVEENRDYLDSVIVHSRDFMFDYFGYKTLEKSYLLKENGKVIERPQFMWLRVALGVHGEDIESAVEMYNQMSQGYYTHATPTLFNSGTPRSQMSSCYLLDMEDSIEGIMDTLSDTAQISKWSGGIGINLSKIRASGSYIKGTGGTSKGLVPVAKLFNENARLWDQGGNKRKGSFALYLEPWHADVFDFLDLKKNQGSETARARDIFMAVSIPDLFMEQVEKEGDWYLMCPNESPGLNDAHSEEFNELYWGYVKEGKYRKKVKARDVWFHILEAQIETGIPYILYKDAANRKSNQKNLGTIRNSNLCIEILEYSGINKQDGEKEIAVCNLASIALPKYIKGRKHLKVDHKKLHDYTYQVTKNLNRVIDRNYYPVKATRTSNMKHRPIAIGVQGLHDLFFKLKIAFDSDEARKVNKEVFETMYHAAISASLELAKEDGAYASFKGSPASQGDLQFDLWGVKPTMYKDWDEIKEQIKEFGLRNSLLLAIMPTASTSQILGNTEACEAITSNIYKRKVLSGEFVVINKYLVEELCEIGLWSDKVKNHIIQMNGSVQDLPYIPEEMKERYKTSWEISQKVIIDMSADRGAFIDQTQSMNLFLEKPNFAKLSSMHFYSWGKRKNGDQTDENGKPVYHTPEDRRLKTGIYYLRSKAAHSAIKFTIQDEAEMIKNVTQDMSQEQLDAAGLKEKVNEVNGVSDDLTQEQIEQIACSLDDPENCESCSA